MECDDECEARRRNKLHCVTDERSTGDLTLLVDLLGLLPTPDYETEREWWDEFAYAERQDRAERKQKDAARDMTGELAAHLIKPAQDPRAFAVCCLKLFDEPSTDMINIVGRRMEAPSSGARLLESICRAAWRIYTSHDGSLRERSPRT